MDFELHLRETCALLPLFGRRPKSEIGFPHASRPVSSSTTFPLILGALCCAYHLISRWQWQHPLIVSTPDTRDLGKDFCYFRFSFIAQTTTTTTTTTMATTTATLITLVSWWNNIIFSVPDEQMMRSTNTNDRFHTIENEKNTSLRPKKWMRTTTSGVGAAAAGTEEKIQTFNDLNAILCFSWCSCEFRSGIIIFSEGRFYSLSIVSCTGV